jgi:hypothetical protein
MEDMKRGKRRNIIQMLDGMADAKRICIKI